MWFTLLTANFEFHNIILSTHTYQDGYYIKKEKCRQGIGETGTLIHCHENVIMVQQWWKMRWKFFKNKQRELTYLSVNHTSGYISHCFKVTYLHIIHPKYIAW